jgi:aryl-alcohol dehydrogenase-like predicted oxidoreductase
MRFRPLGKTGLQVSEIGFGGWAIGGPTEVSGVPVGWGRTSDEDSLAAIRRARDLGVNFFDTADVYGHGRSESLLGLVLSRKRSDAIIATKVGIVRTTSGEHRKDFSKKHIFVAIDGSLKRLRTDYIDLYQIHNPSVADLRRDELHEAMEMLQSWGKIRFWGVSVGTPEEGLEVIRNNWGYTLQVLYNILNQQPDSVLFPEAKEKGYGIIARVPLASGLLTGKYKSGHKFAPDDVRQNFLTERRLDEVLQRIDEAKSILGGSAQTLAQGALRFVLSNDAVATTIPGARTQHQVEANVAAAGEALPAAVVQKLRDRLGEYNFYLRHHIRV